MICMRKKQVFPVEIVTTALPHDIQDWLICDGLDNDCDGFTDDANASVVSHSHIQSTYAADGTVVETEVYGDTPYPLVQILMVMDMEIIL